MTFLDKNYDTIHDNDKVIVTTNNEDYECMANLVNGLNTISFTPIFDNEIVIADIDGEDNNMHLEHVELKKVEKCDYEDEQQGLF